jgi:hypothetical protein
MFGQTTKISFAPFSCPLFSSLCDSILSFATIYTEASQYFARSLLSHLTSEMLLNTFHTRQKSTPSVPIRSSLQQRRDSYQYQQDTIQQVSQFQPTSQTYPSEVDEKIPPSTPNKTPIPSWRNMPRKLQILILALSRLVDFWQMASFQSCMVFQLRSFDTALPSSVISYQAGILTGAFTSAQIVTSILWGRAADSPSLGRKNVILIGLVGTGISCIGVGFSSKFWEAVVWRVMGGAVNGTVGAARTMVAESMGREWHSRAFLTLPVAFNVANVLGPGMSLLFLLPLSL